MVSARPTISNFPAPLPSLWKPFRTHQLQLISPSPSCWIVLFLFIFFFLLVFFCFCTLARFKLLPLFPFFFFFSLIGLTGRQSLLISWFSFFKVWSSKRDLMIGLYLKISENFMFHSPVWFVHLLFDSMISFQFLAQFRMDLFHHQVVSGLNSFGASSLHSLIMWLMVSLLTPQSQH